MRMMLRVTVPTVEGNKALKDGSMEKFIEHSLSELKPEAAYSPPRRASERPTVRGI